MPVELVDVLRGGIVESIHTGSIAVVDSNGRLVYGLGEVERMTFFHSSAKPLQAIAALEAGAAGKFGLEPEEIAILLSSHSGEKEHIAVIRRIIAKLGIEEDAIQCGINEPIGRNVLKELYASGLSPTNLHCNCSGKHLGFIAAAKIMGLPVDGYYRPEHPLQKLLLSILSDFCQVAEEDIATATDGCGVPVYVIPLKNMAWAYANLCNTGFLDGKYEKTQKTILQAMTAFPEMVAGNDRLDTEIMKRFGSKVISKAGAEGVYCMGAREAGLGIALKISDGQHRAAGPAAVEALVQLGVLEPSEARQLDGFWKPEIRNNKGERVGEIQPVFSLKA